MNSNGIVHMTVDHLGALRIYDNPRELNEKKGKTEVQMAISLTAAQMRIVLRAEGVAKGRVQEATKVVAKSNGNVPSEEYSQYLKDHGDPRD